MVTSRTHGAALTVFAVVVGAMVCFARAADAHPLHTTLTELRVDGPRHAVRATIRLFADDLSAALRRSRSATSGSAQTVESRAAAYVATGVTFGDRSGRVIPLRDCGVTRKADLLWVCLEVTAPADLRELTLRNAVLFDAFADQVNIVQTGGERGDGARTHSVLFTRGDGLKRIF